MLRNVLLAAILATFLTAAAGAPPSVSADDPCADPLNDAVGASAVPWQDLCALEVTQVGSNPTTLEVRLTAASADRLTPSIFTVRWDVDGCAHRVVLGDALPDRPQSSQFTVTCEGVQTSPTDCVAELPTTGVVCQEGRSGVAIAPPVLEDGALVWRLTMEGDLAALAGDYGPGTVLEFRSSASGARVFAQQAVVSDIVCVGATCLGGGADLLDASPARLVTE